MGTSLRGDIVTAIETALNGISVTGGYNLDVQTVSTRLRDPDGLTADEFPALFVVDGDENKSDADVNELRCRIQIIISGYVKAPDDSYDIQENLRKLLADVEKAICSDRYLGGKVVNTKPFNIKTDHGVLMPYGIFDFTFEVEYLQLYGDVTAND